MPSDLAATVDVDDRGAIEGSLLRPGASARGVDAGVLEQQQGVGPSPRGTLASKGPLELPRLLVRHATEAGDVHESRLRPPPQPPTASSELSTGRPGSVGGP